MKIDKIFLFSLLEKWSYLDRIHEYNFYFVNQFHRSINPSWMVQDWYRFSFCVENILDYNLTKMTIRTNHQARLEWNIYGNMLIILNKKVFSWNWFLFLYFRKLFMKFHEIFVKSRNKNQFHEKIIDVNKSSNFYEIFKNHHDHNTILLLIRISTRLFFAPNPS